MPKAMAVLWEVARDETVAAADAVATTEEMDSVLGLGLGRVTDITVGIIRPMIQERHDARRRKDFDRADEIRRELAAGGYVLEDTPRGTRVKKGDDVWLIPVDPEGD